MGNVHVTGKGKGRLQGEVQSKVPCCVGYRMGTGQGKKKVTGYMAGARRQ
jgi:hypothetical protein